MWECSNARLLKIYLHVEFMRNNFITIITMTFIIGYITEYLYYI